MNAIVGFPRWTNLVEFSAAGEVAQYPASNLSTLPLSYVWRSPSAANDQTIIYGEITGPISRQVDLVVLCRHNLSISAKVRVILKNADGDPIADKMVRVWASVFTDQQAPWNGGRWWNRTYTIEEVRGYSWFLPILFDRGYYAKSFEIQIDDEGNPDGHVDVGMVEVSQKHVFAENPEVGADFGIEDRTERNVSDGGTVFHRNRPGGRYFNGVLPMVPRQDARGIFFEMQRQLGTHTPFFWWPNPADPLNNVRDAWLAYFSRLDPFTYATAIRYDAVALSLTEVL